MITKWSKRKSNSNKLNNLIEVAENLAKQGSEKDMVTLFLIVKIIADKINNEHSVNLLTNDDNSAFSANHEDKYITNTTNSVKIKQPFSVYLGRDPVITAHWNASRIVSNLYDSGNKEYPWKFDYINHRYRLVLPIGLTYVYNGNHSAQVGCIKGVGKLEYNPDVDNIYDISHFYAHVKFDGTYYCDKQTGKKILEANFDCGCLFELGRIIANNGISFLELKAKKCFDYF